MEMCALWAWIVSLLRAGMANRAIATSCELPVGYLMALAEVIVLFWTTIWTWTGPYAVCAVPPVKVPLTPAGAAGAAGAGAGAAGAAGAGAAGAGAAGAAGAVVAATFGAVVAFAVAGAVAVAVAVGLAVALAVGLARWVALTRGVAVAVGTLTDATLAAFTATGAVPTAEAGRWLLAAKLNTRATAEAVVPVATTPRLIGSTALGRRDRATGSWRLLRNWVVTAWLRGGPTRAVKPCPNRVAPVTLCT